MAQQEIRDVVFNVQVRTEDGKVKIEGLTKSFVKSETAFKKMQDALGQVNDGLGSTATNSGLASTAVLEFGRTVSDAPYGLQGMGNNITQLVTIMGQFTRSAKTSKEALAALKAELMGPLGIVVLIQIAVAALEIFRKSQEGAAKETNKIAEAQARAASSLKIAKDALVDETVALEEKQEIITALNEEYPKWNLTLTESGDISEENVAKIDGEIMALERLAKAKAYQSAIEDLYAEKAQLTSDYMTKQGSITNALTNAVLGYGNTIVGANIQLQQFTNELGTIDEKIKVLGEAMKGEGLIDLILGSDKEGKPNKESRDKVKKFVVDTYDLSIVEAAKYKKEVEKRSKELGIDFASIILGGEEGKKALGEGILGLVDGLEETGTAERLKGIVKNAVFPEDILAGVVDISEIANDLLQSESDRAIDIETNKTNALNDQLRQRLANERLSAEERDKINQQISRNDAALVQKSNELNKKRFQQEKAFSIAQATINTYLAASDVLAKEKGGLAAKIIAMTVTIASGLAQVAAISRQQFVGQALPSPALSAQGTTVAEQTPAFNVVGASSQNQLAAAIAGQTSQPVKAYVVSSDVTTAQELDRKIIQGASI